MAWNLLKIVEQLCNWSKSTKIDWVPFLHTFLDFTDFFIMFWWCVFVECCLYNSHSGTGNTACKHKLNRRTGKYASCEGPNYLAARPDTITDLMFQHHKLGTTFLQFLFLLFFFSTYFGLLYSLSLFRDPDVDI